MAGPKRRGRKAGVPNKVNAATRARIEELSDPIAFLCSVARGDEIEAGDGESVAKKKVRPTLDQRINASRWLADRLLPTAKTAMIEVDLPASDDAEGVLGAVGAVVAGVAAGEIAPDEGKLLADLLEAKRRAVETDDLGRRVAAIESAQGGQSR